MEPLQADKRVLASENVGLAGKVARKLWRLRPVVRNLGGLDDVTGEAMLALLWAADQFDSDKGVQFSTYANKVICRRVVAAASVSGMIRVPLSAPASKRYSTRASQASRLMTPVSHTDSDRLGDGCQVCGTEPEPVDELADREVNLSVGAALKRLPPRQREAVDLVFGVIGQGGVSAKEAAERMGITRSAVYQLVNAATASMKRMLSRGEEGAA